MSILRHRQAQQTHCKRGHEFTPENTRLRGDTMQRKCRACDAMLARERYHAKKDAA